jgi:hypothetical protein
LYVDSIPYLVTKTLELIAGHRQDRSERGGQRLVAVANCGFPEAQHNETALAICRRFAREARFEWVGGLSLGGGQALHGRALIAVPSMARNAMTALEMTAEALVSGKPLPESAVEVMAKPIVPARVYTWLGGFGWKQQARNYGTHRQLHARPYTVD